jgi:serine protease Do
MQHSVSPQLKPFLIGLSISLVILASAFGGAIADRLFVIKPLDYFAKRGSGLFNPGQPSTTPLFSERETSVISIADQSSASVVTISVKTKRAALNRLNPFGGLFGFGFDTAPSPSEPEEIKQDIGTGFVVDEKAGLIVTNRHVISDTDVEYLVIDKDGTEYPVKNIYRDPTNDIGIVRIDAQLKSALNLGDSDQLKVGQSVIAIGTALGEFRHTVTTGVISGLGRGITAGDGFGFSSEKLDNVIQTDAAINPGNSGGPLIDSQGSVIGVNVAVAGNAQNIGFAIPINIVREILKNFNETGKFERPFMGIQYQIIPQKTAIMNELPEGAYLVAVTENSSASDAGLQAEDIITKFDGKELKESDDLAAMINLKKIGDKVEVEYWRNNEKKTVTVTLKERAQ